MAIVLPTASEFKARYPAFTSVGDALIGAVIGEATVWIDETWIAADIKPAAMAFAAHQLQSEGYGAASISDGNGGSITVAGPVTSVEVGDVKTKFSDAAMQAGASSGSKSSSSFSSTSFGVKFLEYVRKNSSGVLVV